MRQFTTILKEQFTPNLLFIFNLIYVCESNATGVLTKNRQNQKSSKCQSKTSSWCCSECFQIFNSISCCFHKPLFTSIIWDGTLKVNFCCLENREMYSFYWDGEGYFVIVLKICSFKNVTEEHFITWYKWKKNNILYQTVSTWSRFIICATKKSCCPGLWMHLKQTPTRAAICFRGSGFSVLGTYIMIHNKAQ